MVLLNISMVVIPFLLYWTMVYRTQYNDQVARDFRSLAEIDRRFQDEIDQFGTLFDYVPDSQLSLIAQALSDVARQLDEAKDQKWNPPKDASTDTGATVYDCTLVPKFSFDLDSWLADLTSEGTATLSELRTAALAVRSQLATLAVRCDEQKNDRTDTGRLLASLGKLAQELLVYTKALSLGANTPSVPPKELAIPEQDWVSGNVSRAADKLHEIATVFYEIAAKRLKGGEKAHHESLKQTPGYERLEIATVETSLPPCKDPPAPSTEFHFRLTGQSQWLEVTRCQGARSVSTERPQHSSANRSAATKQARVPLADLLLVTTTSSQFPTLLLVTDRGNVLYERGRGNAGSVRWIALEFPESPSERQIAPGILFRVARDTKGGESSSKPPAGPSYSSLPFHQTLELGEVSHELFVQPLSAALQDSKGNAIRLYLVGATPSSEFRAAVMEVRLTILGLALAALLLAASLLPYLKLTYMGAMDQVRERDIYMLVAGLLMGAGFVTLLILAAASYRAQREAFTNLVGRSADSIRTDFEEELVGSLEELSSEVERLLRTDKVDTRPADGGKSGASQVVDPGKACEYLPKLPYGVRCDYSSDSYPPYELLLFLNGRGDMVGPIQNCRAAELPSNSLVDREYYRRAIAGPRFQLDPSQRSRAPKRTDSARGRNGSTGELTNRTLNLTNTAAQMPGRADLHSGFFMERIRARDTGTRLTVFSAALTRQGEAPADSSSLAQRCDVRVVAMAKRMRTFWASPREPELGFAVVEDSSGTVLYHTDDSRSLVENFFAETGGARFIASSIAARRDATGAARYRGNDVVLALRPLPSVPWTLIVFGDKQPLAAASLDAGMVAGVHYLGFLALLLFGVWLTTQTIPGHPWAWVWPQPHASPQYATAALASALAGVSVLILVSSASGWATIPALLALPPLLFTSLYRAFDPDRAVHPERHRMATCCFVVATATILFVTIRLGRIAAPEVAIVALCSLIAALALLQATQPTVKACSAPGPFLIRNYTALAFTLLLVLSIVPAVTLHIDADAVSRGRLALYRAREAAESIQIRDAAYRRDYHRIHPSQPTPRKVVFDRTTAKSPSKVPLPPGAVVDCSSPLDEDPAEDHEQPLARSCWKASVEVPCDTHDNPSELPTDESFWDRLAPDVSTWARGHPTSWLALQTPRYSDLSAQFRALTGKSPSLRDGLGGYTSIPQDEEQYCAVGMPGTFQWCAYDPQTDGTYNGFRRYPGTPSTPAHPEAFVFLLLLVVVGWAVFRMTRGVVEPLLAMGLRTSLLSKGVLDQLSPSTSRELIVRASPDLLAELRGAASAHHGPANVVSVESWGVVHPDGDTARLMKRALSARHVFIEGFELVLRDAKIRTLLLILLEDLLRQKNVQITILSDVAPNYWLTHAESDSDSLDSVEDGAAGTAPADPQTSQSTSPDDLSTRTNPSPAEALRWSRILAEFGMRFCVYGAPSRNADNESFTTWLEAECSWAPELARVRERIEALHAIQPLNREQATREIVVHSEAFYRKLWNSCTLRERFAMIHLARGNLCNPRNLDATEQLLRRGILRFAPDVRFASDAFEKFAATAEPAYRVVQWKRHARASTWALIRLPVALLLVAAAGLLAYVSRDAVNATAGLLGAIATTIPVMLRILGSIAGSRDNSHGTSSKS